MPMNDITSYTKQNSRAWDEIAHIREKKFPPAEHFLQGNCTLPQNIREAAGPVQDKSLLHLQCASGTGTLSWSVLGAHAIGVDISPKQIAIAQQKAQDAGLSTSFIAADVYALPNDLQNETFDVVFTGGGALVWLPDIEKWAQIVVAALKPGGRLILEEEHPVAQVLWAEEGMIKMDSDYFGRHEAEEHRGWSHFKGGEEAQETKYEFSWPLGDIITGLARAGMRIESLEEGPSQAEYRFGAQLTQVARLPGEYLLIARKG
ncbi:MAG: class I SAM-dependent methyltransferase [Chloroflexota bacterium]